jgi:hypothetical protein
MRLGKLRTMVTTPNDFGSTEIRIRLHEIPECRIPSMEGSEVCAAVLDRDGVTMGLLFDTAVALLRGCDSSYPFFRLSFGIDIPNDLDGVRPPDNDASDSDDGSDSDEGQRWRTRTWQEAKYNKGLSRLLTQSLSDSLSRSGERLD